MRDCVPSCFFFFFFFHDFCITVCRKSKELFSKNTKKSDSLKAKYEEFKRGSQTFAQYCTRDIFHPKQTSKSFLSYRQKH